MSASSADRTITETERLLAEVDRHEQEDADAARRAEMSRPLGPEVMAGEASSLHRLSPRRNRWSGVVEFDQRAAELEQRQRAVHAELLALHERLAAAPAADTERLAQWQLAGGKGARPVPEAEALAREIAQRQADYDALTAATAAVLAEKAAYVEKHRKRLVRDADQAVDGAHAEVLEAIDRLTAAREKLAELRGEAVWAAIFPHEAVGETLQGRLIAGGALLPACRALGVTWQLDAAGLLDVLREDAGWFKAGATPAQRTALAGRDPRKPAATTWADSDEYRAERKAEIDEAVQAFRQEWGQDPTEAQLVAFIESRRSSRLGG